MRKSEKSNWILPAFLLLAGVSLYRQISLHLMPHDLLRPYLVYTVYLVLIFGWAVSIRIRFTQKSMRIFLLCNAGVMAFWMTIRFVQDAFLYKNTYWMRYFGYYILIPAIIIPLLGFYASLGLGRGDDYRFSDRWYFLVLPAAALIMMALTDNFHHFVCYIVKSEPQPNLYFHPFIGSYLIYAWVFVLICGRTAVIYRRNRAAGNSDLPGKIAPFAEILMLVFFITPYSLSSFIVDWELIEYSAGIFFIEAVSWEIYILLGLIPVNAQYETVFDLSTVAMQIISREGIPYVRSCHAPVLKEKTLQTLMEESFVSDPEGKELRMFPLQNSYLVWQKDVSQMNMAIRNLQRSTEELKQEGSLLRRELEFRSEDIAAREQDRIYNQLTREVGTQLSLMNGLLDKARQGEDSTAVFHHILFVGTYIKRRCNLRLTELPEGRIFGEDLEMSFRNLLDCLSECGVKTMFSGQVKETFSSDFGLKALDIFELIIEHELFEPECAEIRFCGDFYFSIYTDRTVPEVLKQMKKLTYEDIRGGYRVILREGDSVS